MSLGVSETLQQWSAVSLCVSEILQQCSAVYQRYNSSVVGQCLWVYTVPLSVYNGDVLRQCVLMARVDAQSRYAVRRNQEV